MMYNNHKFLDGLREHFDKEVEQLLQSELWETIESSKLPKERHEEVFGALLEAFDLEDFDTDVDYLDKAFVWNDSIQGHDYWENIHNLIDGDYFE